MSKTGLCKSRCANQRSSPYMEFPVVDWSVQSVHRSKRVAHRTPINVVDIPLGIRRVMTILPLSRHTFKVSLGISHIIHAVTTHTESTSVQSCQSQKCISCTWRNVGRRREIRYAVNGCTEKLSTRALIYHSECK